VSGTSDTKQPTSSTTQTPADNNNNDMSYIAGTTNQGLYVVVGLIGGVLLLGLCILIATKCKKGTATDRTEDADTEDPSENNLTQHSGLKGRHNHVETPEEKKKREDDTLLTLYG
jgi:hypothetical protein